MYGIKENIIELKDVIVDKLENMSIVNNMVKVFILDSTSNKCMLNEHSLTFKKISSGNIIISSDIWCEKTIYNNIKIYDCVSIRINSDFISMISEFSKELKLTLLDKFYKIFSKVYFAETFDIPTAGRPGDCLFRKFFFAGGG
jgi:hypothetical protein